MSLTELNLDKHYEGLGKELNKRFLVPALKASVSYDRLTSYFTVESFLSCAEGIDTIWEKKGKIRLLLGIHSIPRDLLVAKRGDSSVETLIELAKANLLEGVRSITDEMARNKIGVLAMMMLEEFLDIRVATPLDDNGQDSGGILHSKRYIFHDESFETVVAIGSPNETVSALSRNFEEITVHSSWQDKNLVHSLVASFERMWNDQREDLDVRPLDKEFAAKLLEALGPEPNKDSSYSNGVIKSLLEFIRKSPEFAFTNIAKAALFPHQERALRDAVSRWPLRVLLADEVGLGKTIEAGSVIAYARRELKAKRILILTPAGLRRQWQSEMKTHFGIEAAIFESDSASYIYSDGKRIDVSKPRPLDGAPECIIVSWQLVRTSWMKNEVFENAIWKPDLILVDEAHSARRNKGLDGRIKTTLVWEMVKRLSEMCPHLVLLTATPMQMQVEEYHGLLMLLGLPEWWNDSDTFVDFLGRLDGLKARNELAPANLMLEGITKSIGMFDHPNPMLSLISQSTHDAMKEGKVPFQVVRTYASDGEALRIIGINLTPPSALTVRNTRTGLESIGYKFPLRKFHSPTLEVDESVKRFLRRIDGYLDSTYGMVEQILGNSKGGANAFIKSIYYQRLVSSLSSAGKTLGRRVDKLNALIESDVWSYAQEEVDQDDLDILDIDDEAELTEKNLQAAKQSARVEVQAIEGMLRDIDEALALSGDAKMNALSEVLIRSLAAGDSILVFSRFKDTVDACIETMEGWLIDEGYGYGCYTGQGAWTAISGKRVDADKTVICDALRNGDIKVVFCSDAASEGLNLQSARQLINVDVPWNPARLEQRIGRIARLGQKAEVVDIYNLWFPGTVESKMYSKLLDRQELYSLAVGEFPEVVGEVIRNRLKTDGSLDFGDIESPLNELRGKAEYSALRRIWASPTKERSMGTVFREYLFNTLKAYGQHSNSIQYSDDHRLEVLIDGTLFKVRLQPGDRDSISLYHPVINALEKTGSIKSDILDRLHILESETSPVCLMLARGPRYSMLDPLDTLQAIRHLMLGDVAEPDGHGFLNTGSDDAEILATLRKTFPFRIELGEVKVTVTAKVPPIPNRDGNYRIVKFCNYFNC